MKAFALLLCSLFLFGLGACQRRPQATPMPTPAPAAKPEPTPEAKKGVFEKAGEKMDQGLRKTGEGLKEAGEEIEEGFEKAGEKLQGD